MPRGRPLTPGSRYLLTPRTLAETYGLPFRVAQSLVRAMDREGQAYRFRGLRAVFVDRRDVEARLYREADDSTASGASSGTISCV